MISILTLVPLVMWIGFAGNIEVPKVIVFQALALALVALALADPGKRQRLIQSPLTLPLIGLAVSALVSCAVSGAAVVSWAGEQGSWMGASQVGTLVLGALIASAWLTRVLANKVFFGALGAAVVMLVYALLQKLQLDPIPWNPELKSSYWLFATLGNPVHLGNFLACAFWLSFAVRILRGWPAWIFRVALVVGVVVTGQRSALLALACGVGVVLWQYRRGCVHPVMSLSPRSMAGWGAGLCAMALIAALVLSPADRMWSLASLMGARPEIWKAAGRLVCVYPWLGIGPDLFHAHFLSVASYAYFIAEPPGAMGEAVHLRLPASAHNELVSLATTQGLLGLGLYLWALLVAARAGRSSPLLPAVASCWVVHLTNPASAATAALFWILVAALAVPKSPPSPCPSPPLGGGEGRVRGIGTWIAGGSMAVFLVCALATSLRTGVAQAHRREAGRLAFYGRSAELVTHLSRWSSYAGRVHPRQAHDDAMLLRAQWEAGPGDVELAKGAIALWEIARRANPYNIFYLSALADFELARGKRHQDERALKESEALIRQALRLAPAALSLYDDLAGALEAQGKLEEAKRLRALRKRLDVKGLFAPEGD